MTFDALRLLEHIHGHVGWLSALALVHPAILLRRTQRRAKLAAAAATILSTLTAAMGAMMYASYRIQIKPLLFAEAPALGWAFERKEHLGTAAVMLAWGGLASHHAAHSPKSGHNVRLARVAHVSYVAAAASAVLAATLGVVVASQRTFP
jgi:hypothetical protein